MQFLRALIVLATWYMSHYTLLSKYGYCTCRCFYESVKVEKESWYSVGISKKKQVFHPRLLQDMRWL